MGDRSRKEFLQVMNRPNRYISRAALEDTQVSFEALRWYYEGKDWLCDRIDKLEEDLYLLKEYDALRCNQLYTQGYRI